MFEEANAELEEIDPFCRHLPEVLLARLAIYHGLKKWDLLAVVAKRLTAWNPKEPGFFVELAYATRRAESIHAAHAILTRAASLHPTDPTIQFNIACYEAQMGSLDRAKAHLKRATEIDAKFKLMALEDPDLEPVWASFGYLARVREAHGREVWPLDGVQTHHGARQGERRGRSGAQGRRRPNGEHSFVSLAPPHTHEHHGKRGCAGGSSAEVYRACVSGNECALYASRN